MFKRGLADYLIERLKEEPLFKECLLPDIKKGEVFPAIRNGYIDFYYMGGRLFLFDDNGFSTHTKYASVLDHPGNYITQDELTGSKHILSFIRGYKRIKENCSLYAGIERSSLWEMHKKYSYIKNPDIMVLDIEVSFAKGIKNQDEFKRGRDQIDLLIFNRKENILRFYEAKYYSNSEIWADDKNPKVLTQIKRYNEQISNNYSDIISQYKEYVDIVNKLFDINLDKPSALDKQAGLLVFGFDSDQRDGRLKKYIGSSIHFKGINYYPIGELKGLKIVNMWNH